MWLQKAKLGQCILMVDTIEVVVLHLFFWLQDFRIRSDYGQGCSDG